MTHYEFTPSEVEDNGSDFSEPVKGGNHQMHIIASEIHTAESGAVGFKPTYEILGGPNKGRRIWDYINLVKKDGQPNEIGEKQLSKLCAIFGIDGFKDTESLHNKQFTGFVKLVPNADKMEARVAGFDNPKIVKSLYTESDPPF